ncbi:MAG: coenzyme F420-0:L-glutamate ligase [Chloroflexi bacterium]|nr:coenzyme F420-0:L-glutamate ligase [Chloroflexota bacterium]MCL5074400.1 coenzyme F420-0:L-glutamate ligase [Chloroflexota bacterium]
MEPVTLIPLEGMPHIQKGADLTRLVYEAAERSGYGLNEGDIVVIAQKVVSKSEGRLVDLNGVQPSARASDLAAATGKEARLVELILQESAEVLRARDGVLIVEQRLGFVCANAGIDRSNIPQGDGIVVGLLPHDPDASARRIRRRIRDLCGRDVAVIINDTHGRAFREGAVGVAIGISGMVALLDRRGHRDLYGYELRSTIVAMADEIAAAASMLMGQSDEGIPAVIVRGLIYPRGEGSARELLRPKEKDLFR